MLLHHRVRGIDPSPVPAAKGYEHVPADAVAVLRWLNAAGVDYVLVGALARAVRGDRGARGPVAIVPAPYERNLDRLARALSDVRAGERNPAALLGIAQAGHARPLRLTTEQLVGPERWALSCGAYDLDIEGRPSSSPSYQELLYDSVRIELAEGVAAEVAAPEDIEHYDHVRRTGVAPEILVNRLP